MVNNGEVFDLGKLGVIFDILYIYLIC